MVETHNPGGLEAQDQQASDNSGAESGLGLGVDMTTSASSAGLSAENPVDALAKGATRVGEVQEGLAQQISGETGGRSESAPLTLEAKKRAFAKVLRSQGTRAATLQRETKGTGQEQPSPLLLAMTHVRTFYHDSVLTTPSMGVNIVEGSTAWFSPTDPRPRVRVLGGGAYGQAFDKRTEVGSDTPSTIPQGVIELQTYRGVTTDADGQRIIHFGGKDANDTPVLDVALPVDQAAELFFLTSVDDIKRGIDSSTPPAVAQAVVACEKFVASINARHPLGQADFDMTSGMGDQEIRRSLEQTTVSPAAVIAFADKMSGFIMTSSWQGTPDERNGCLARINVIKDKLHQGNLPSAQDLQDVLVLAATPKLNEQVASFRVQRQKAEKEGKSTLELDDAIVSIEGFIAGKDNNLYRTYLNDLVSGEASADDAIWFNAQIQNANSPWAILGDHDLNDPNCLAGRVKKHFKDKLGDKKWANAESFLAKLLREKGQDIAMMGIFALFQMMTTMIGDAVQKASH